MYKIEKGIPISAKSNASEELATASIMEVGDSFLVEVANPSQRNAKAACVSSSLCSKKLSFANGGKKFSIRKITDCSFRVWRTK